MDGDLMSVRDVARACERSEETVRRWIWSGKLAATKLGNQLFVKRSDVEALQRPKASESRTRYRTTHVSLRRKGDEKLLYTPVEYDPDEMLAHLEKIRKMGDVLEKKYGFYDVSEALRRVREDYD